MQSSLEECRVCIFSEVLALVVLISYACTEVCRPSSFPHSPAHGRARFGTGGSHSVLVRPVAVVAFKIGVTEFARVFQNRALSGGKPNLMLSRMGGGAAVWLQMGSLQKVNLCLASLHCLRQFIIGIPVCSEWNRRTNLSPRKSGHCCLVRILGLN